MGLKKTENQVKIMLADTILAMCSSTVSYKSEIRVEGLLGVTVDNQEVFLVQVNKTMRKGLPQITHKVITPRKIAQKSALVITPTSQGRDHREGETSTQGAGQHEGETSPSTRRSKRKRQATWKLQASDGFDEVGDEDHNYTPVRSSDDSHSEPHRKSQRTSQSQDIQDENGAADDYDDEEEDDNDDDDRPIEQHVVYVNEEGVVLATSSEPVASTSGVTSTGAPGDIAVVNLQQQLASTADGAANIHEEIAKSKKRRDRRNKKRTKKPCSICGKLLPDSHKVKIHERIHTGERPYSCEYCDHTFTQLSGKTVHIKNVHLKLKVDKPVKNLESKTCKTCGKVFRDRYRLKLHMVVHTRNKPYECQVCHKGYSSPSSLRNHEIASHGSQNSLRNQENASHQQQQQPDEMPCEVCGEVLQSLEDLQMHTKQHESPQLHCPICDAVFDQVKDMKAHILDFHKEVGVIHVIDDSGADVTQTDLNDIVNIAKSQGLQSVEAFITVSESQ